MKKAIMMMNRFQLPLFLILAFAFSWPIMIIDALGSLGVLNFRVPIPLLVLMGYGPTIAALMVTGLVNGRAGLRFLLRQLSGLARGHPMVCYCDFWYGRAVFSGLSAFPFIRLPATGRAGNANAPFHRCTVVIYRQHADQWRRDRWRRLCPAPAASQV